MSCSYMDRHLCLVPIDFNINDSCSDLILVGSGCHYKILSLTTMLFNFNSLIKTSSLFPSHEKSKPMMKNPD